MSKVCGECGREYSVYERHCYCLDVSEMRFQLKMDNIWAAGDAYDCLKSHHDVPEPVVQQLYAELRSENHD